MLRLVPVDEFESFICDQCGDEIVTGYAPERSKRGRYICSTCGGAMWLERHEERLAGQYEAGTDADWRCFYGCTEPSACKGDCWRHLVDAKAKDLNQGKLF